MSGERIRRSVSAKLRGLPIGDVFAEATAAAEAHILARSLSKRRLGDKKDLQRAARKARRLERTK